MKISIIIPVYNASLTLKECLDSIFDSSFKDFEVILVSDNSTDESVKIAKKYNCTIIELKENKGPALARNTGAKAAKGDLLLFIDSDVEFQPEAVLRMLVAKKDIICTPYRVKSEDTSKSIYTVDFVKPMILENGLIEIKAGPTGLMLIKKEVFEKIIKNFPELKIKNPVLPNPGKDHDYYYNYFDFKFDKGYSVGEDVAFCQLARAAGFKIFANTESWTKHHGSWTWEGKFGEALHEA